MATVDKYKIELEVAGEGKVKSLTNSIGGLGSALAGVGFGVFVSNAFKMADALNDVADATGLTAGYIKGLGNAVQQAGGEMNDVGNIVNRFYQNIDDLAQGSDKAIRAFEKLGIQQKDLLKTSRQDILGITLKRLSEMGPSAERTALGIEIFGKAFGKIDPKKLDEILRTQDFEKLDVEIRKAGEAFGAMQDNILVLQQAILSVLTPFIGEIDNMRLSAEQAEKIIKTLGITLGIVFAAKTISAISQAAVAMRAFAAAAALAARNPLVRALALGGLAVGGLFAGKSLLTDEETTTPGAPGTASERNAGATKDAAAATVIEKSNREKAAEAAARTTEQMRKQIDLANNFRRLQIDLLGIQEDYAQSIKEDAAVTNQLQNDVLDLQNRINEEKAKESEANQGVIRELTEQLKLKQQQAATNLLLNQQERERAQQIKNQTLEAQNYNRDQDLRTQVEYMDAMRNAMKGVGDARKISVLYAQRELDVFTKLRPISKEIANTLLGQNATLEQRKDIETDLMLFADAVNQNARIALLDQTEYTDRLAKIEELRLSILNKLQGKFTNLNAEQQKQLQLLIERLQRESEILAILEQQRKLDEQAKTAQQGSIDALDQIVQSFEPYKMAQDAILGTWNKIGSAIDTFIETGKFKFSDFARSVVQDLAKMIAKAMIFKAISATLGAFGLSIPGMAKGGPVQAGQPYLVGEKGPELFVPPGAGQIIPNNKLNQSSPTKMSAPTGAATNIYNTYNINAIDAKSVAQLFAENRKAIFGANKMAEREMSYAGVR